MPVIKAIVLAGDQETLRRKVRSFERRHVDRFSITIELCSEAKSLGSAEVLLFTDEASTAVQVRSGLWATVAVTAVTITRRGFWHFLEL